MAPRAESQPDEKTRLTGKQRSRTWQSWTSDVEDGKESEVWEDRELEPWEKDIQRDFIFKVYSILLVQIVVTVGLGAACCTVPTLREKCLDLVRNNFGVVLGCGIGGSLVSLMLLACCFRDSYPLNFILLTAFTFFEASTLAIISVLSVTMGKEKALMAAAGTTAAIFLGLTLYVKFSTRDFSFLGPFLFVALLASCLLSLIAYIFNLGAMTFGLHLFGVLLWSAFIIYDTDQILKRTSVEEMSEVGTAIMGAVDLYLDIINLFLDLLYLFDRFNL